MTDGNGSGSGNGNGNGNGRRGVRKIWARHARVSYVSWASVSCLSKYRQGTLIVYGV